MPPQDDNALLDRVRDFRNALLRRDELGELLLVEPGVVAAAAEELGVGAPLDDAAGVQHEHLVRSANRRQPVCDHQRRAAR